MLKRAMIYGLLAKKGHGKDTVADYLSSNYQFQKHSFASPLKESCKILFNFSDDQVYGDKKEEIDPNWETSPRKIMQYLGTEIFRKDINNIIPGIEDNFWVRNVVSKYLNALENDPETRFVISDVRFKNEVDAIQKLGGTIIKIERPLESLDDHESEKDIDNIKNYNYLIKNDDTIEELYKKVDNLMKKKSNSNLDLD